MQTRAVLDQLQQDFQHVILLREFDDLPVEGLQVRNLGSLVGIEYTNNLLRPGNQAAKRALDLVLAGAALVAAAPVILFAALLVRLIDGGPVFFHQNRAGLGGPPHQRAEDPHDAAGRGQAARGASGGESRFA